MKTIALLVVLVISHTLWAEDVRFPEGDRDLSSLIPSSPSLPPSELDQILGGRDSDDTDATAQLLAPQTVPDLYVYTGKGRGNKQSPEDFAMKEPIPSRYYGMETKPARDPFVEYNKFTAPQPMFQDPSSFGTRSYGLQGWE